MSRADAHLLALAAPELARWWKRVRERLEREPTAIERGKVSLPDASAAEIAAMAALIGRRADGPIRLADLDGALRAGPAGLTLLSWLGRDAPLVDRPAERAREDAAIQALVDGAAAVPDLRTWLSAGGQARRLVRGQRSEDVAGAVRVLAALPGHDLPIARFANAVLGHAKALDGTPVENIVLAVLAARANVDKPASAPARRELWERFGVVPDDLASQVLVLNVTARGGRLAEWLTAARGVPFRVTLHQLVRFPIDVDGPVYVCENPAVVRIAAERLAHRSATVLCTEGQPSAAFWRLLRAVRGPVRVRADFDPAGVGIVDAVVAERGEPWRMDVATYDLAVGTLPFAGQPREEVRWAPGLVERMRKVGALGEEERIVDLLVDDLGSQSAIQTQ